MRRFPFRALGLATALLAGLTVASAALAQTATPANQASGAGTTPAFDPVADSFADPELQTRYRALLHELRCVVCQNQSLADSHVDLARNLRHQVQQQMAGGSSDAQIKQYMVDRYGEFVLYKPRFSAHTAIVWLLPGVVALLAVIVVLRLRSGRERLADAPLSAAEQARLDALMDNDRNSPS